MVSDLIKIGKALLSIVVGLLVGLALLHSDMGTSELGGGIWMVLAIYSWLFCTAEGDVPGCFVRWAKNISISGLPVAAIIWLGPGGIASWILFIGIWGLPVLIFMAWVVQPAPINYGQRATHLRGRFQTSVEADPIALRRKQREAKRHCQTQQDEGERHG